MQTSYFKEVVNILQRIEDSQTPKMQQAAALLAQTVAEDGLIYTMGSGHSQSVALEAFHRSGSLACVSAVMDPSFNFYPTAHAATAIERLEGYTPIVLKKHNLTDKDCLIVISNSGRNAAGIDAAIYAKKLGVKVIVITALLAHAATPSRHSSDKMLRDFADIALDNCVCKEETCLQLEGKDIAPISTIAGAAIINNIMYLAAKILAGKGINLPLYLSSNNNGDVQNTKLAAKYTGRIKQLA